MQGLKELKEGEEVDIEVPPAVPPPTWNIEAKDQQDIVIVLCTSWLPFESRVLLGWTLSHSFSSPVPTVLLQFFSPNYSKGATREA
jgi:hypothetical protein